MQKLLSRIQAAQTLTERGFTTAPATLARLASAGGGPTFIKYGRWARYDEVELLRWAEGRAISRSTTSDAGRPLAGAT